MYFFSYKDKKAYFSNYFERKRIDSNHSNKYDGGDSFHVNDNLIMDNNKVTVSQKNQLHTTYTQSPGGMDQNSKDLKSSRTNMTRGVQMNNYVKNDQNTTPGGARKPVNKSNNYSYLSSLQSGDEKKFGSENSGSNTQANDVLNTNCFIQKNIEYNSNKTTGKDTGNPLQRSVLIDDNTNGYFSQNMKNSIINPTIKTATNIKTTQSQKDRPGMGGSVQTLSTSIQNSKIPTISNLALGVDQNTNFNNDTISIDQNISHNVSSFNNNNSLPKNYSNLNSYGGDGYLRNNVKVTPNKSSNLTNNDMRSTLMKESGLFMMDGAGGMKNPLLTNPEIPSQSIPSNLDKSERPSNTPLLYTVNNPSGSNNQSLGNISTSYNYNFGGGGWISSRTGVTNDNKKGESTEKTRSNNKYLYNKNNNENILNENHNLNEIKDSNKYYNYNDFGPLSSQYCNDNSTTPNDYKAQQSSSNGFPQQRQFSNTGGQNNREFENDLEQQELLKKLEREVETMSEVNKLKSIEIERYKMQNKSAHIQNPHIDDYYIKNDIIISQEAEIKDLKYNTDNQEEENARQRYFFLIKKQA